MVRQVGTQTKSVTIVLESIQMQSNKAPSSNITTGKADYQGRCKRTNSQKEPIKVMITLLNSSGVKNTMRSKMQLSCATITPLNPSKKLRNTDLHLDKKED